MMLKPRELRVEARPDQDGRRERRGTLVVRPVAGVRDAHAGVAALQGRDAEPRDPGRIARAHVRDFWGNALVARHADRGKRAKETDDEREAFVVGHLLLGRSRALVGRFFLRRRNGRHDESE
jgi:hypothetical protein